MRRFLKIYRALSFHDNQTCEEKIWNWLGLKCDLPHLRLRYHCSAFRVHKKVEENRRHAEDPGRQCAEWRKWNVFRPPYQEVEQIQFCLGFLFEHWSFLDAQESYEQTFSLLTGWDFSTFCRWHRDFFFFFFQSPLQLPAEHLKPEQWEMYLTL